MSRLASHICEHDLYQVEISRQYGPEEWHEDIRKILKKIVLTDNHATFLFSDSQVCSVDLQLRFKIF